MNYKKWLCGVGALALCFTLTGCHIKHDWQEATCTEPKTCSIGGETEGEPLGHTWVEATCTEPKTCSVCGETEGEPLGHTLTEANYQQAATCEVCGETVGEPLQAEFEKYGLVCNAELDTTYPYVIPCYDAGYTTNGKVTFSDYETFESDETHEALDGYEWKAVTYTVIFDDENAYYHGYSGIRMSALDYYDNSFFDNYDEKADTYTANYNGVQYSDIQFDFESLQEGWVNDIFTSQTRMFCRIPKGYDGIVMVMFSPSLDSYLDSHDNNTYELAKENNDTILFRLKQHKQ